MIGEIMGLRKESTSIISDGFYCIQEIQRKILSTQKLYEL